MGLMKGYYMRKSCKLAFTLAEVLVTLGIIGVVAALTMPVLIQNYQKKSYVVQLHKIYTEFQQGFLMKMNEKNAVNLKEAGFRSSSDYNAEKEFLKSHFKVVKDCGTTASGCFAPSYSGLAGGNTKITGIVPNNYSYNVVIASGAAISFHIGGSNTVGYIYVDTNGQKGPNKGGRDLFRMYIYPDGVLDDYYIDENCRKNNVCTGAANAQEARERNFKAYCANAHDTDGCFGKLLNDNWEMNY